MDHRHAVAPALLASGNGNGLPVRHFLVGPLAAQAQYAVRRDQRLNAGDAEFGRLLDQPVHAVVGRHADGEVDGARCFALDGLVRLHMDRDVAAAHAFDRRGVLATMAIEQGDVVARLHPQHLDMARNARRQRQRDAA